MSRLTLPSFLRLAKSTLSHSLRNKGSQRTSFVIGNQSADLDSITCALVYGYIRSSTPEARKQDHCVIPITNIPSSELRLRPELTALLKRVDLKPTDLVTLDDLGDKPWDSLSPEKTDWTLVDHNVLLGELGEHYSDRVGGVIDHHEDEDVVPKDAEPRVIEKTGSCASHVVNYCREVWDSISKAGAGKGDGDVDPATTDARLAKLALGAILIDTVNFKAEAKVTEHDRKAVSYLENKIQSAPGEKDFDTTAFFEEINAAKSDLSSLSLEEILRKDYKQWDPAEGEEKAVRLGISSCVRSVEWLLEKSAEDKESSNFIASMTAFAKDRELDLYALMTAHNDSPSFSRQLLLMAMKDGRATEVADKFVEVNEKEFELEKSGTELQDPKKGEGEQPPWLKFWEQKNLAASRKQVAPALREAMG